MIIGRRQSPILLFAGDIVVFILSLFITLWIRHLEIPNTTTLAPYIVPFTILFAFWAIIFYSAGLYSKRFILFPSRLPDTLLKTQIANMFFAVLFFFFIPAFGIAPKTILVLYLIVSLVLIFLWRFVVYPHLSANRVRDKAILLARGVEADELFAEVNGNSRYGIEFCSRKITKLPVSIVVVDDAIATSSLVGSDKQIIAFEDIYEEVFDRVPLSRLERAWFRENISSSDPPLYFIVKRSIDIIGGLIMGLVTFVVAPFIYIANLFEGNGSLFIRQERFGKSGTRIIVYKFRSMQKNISASGQWMNEGENRVTRVGSFLRLTSLDEFPQFINVIRGDMSLIGPRNDILGLGKRLSEALPYYEARYLVVPGITGWAQINQQYEQGNVSPQSIEETKMRLAYDFYYLKHRSLGLDIIIAIKTLKRMFFRAGSR